MILESPLSPKEYRAAVRDKFENFHNFWEERYSGFFLGSCFCICHHSYTEWNRRITGEMNNAIGFLKKTEDGCRVYFIHTTGLLNPFYMLVYFALFSLISLFYWQAEGLPSDHLWISWLLSGVSIVLCAIGTAISHGLTENGIRGGDSLYNLMFDPTFGGTE